MYLIGLAVFTVFLGWSTALTGELRQYIDIPNMIIILTFSISMLMASGLFPDFLRCFKIMGQKENPFSTIELQKSREAVILMIKLLLLSGVLGTMIGMVAVFSGPAEHMLPNTVVAVIALLYSVLLVFILLPIRSRINAILLTKE